MPPSKESTHHRYIDALRGIAVISVVISHSTKLLVFPGDYLMTFGVFGVQLFFIISAFTLFQSLSVRGSEKEERTVLKYFIRRFFRIAPPFWFAVALYTVIYGRHDRGFGGGEVDKLSVVLSLLFLQGYLPNAINNVVPGGWSIAVETSFYLLVPWLFKHLKTLRSAVLLTAVSLILAIVLNVTLIHAFGDFFAAENRRNIRFLYFFLPYQFPVLSLGFVLFHLQKGQGINPRHASSHLACLFAYLGAVSAVRWAGLMKFPVYFEVYFPVHFLFGIGFVYLAAIMARAPISLLVNGLTCYLGKISFSCYLFHFLVINILIAQRERLVTLNTSSGATNALLVLGLLGGVLGLGSIGYYFIEVPAMRIGRYATSLLGVQRSPSSSVLAAK
jgi:peptidoglycan/LPS O-acetylase OafA/YrhL